MKARVWIAVAALVFLANTAPVAQAQTKNNAETYRLLNLMGDVFERVRGEYVEEVADQELIEAALAGMLSSLDPHSAYMNSKNFRDMQVQTKGEFGGLGIEVTMDQGLVKVVSPIDDTPAFRAGLKPNDLITHIDGEQVQGLALDEAIDRMRGPVDTQVRLTIRRQGVDPFDVSLTRAVIRIQAVRARREGDAAYIRITSFNEQTDANLKKAVADMKKEIGPKLSGYVIDLRNNPGGLLDQAVAVSDAFLEQGEIVSTRSRKLEETQRFNARPGDVTSGLPVVVLVNEGSASASEIVAGALQDHKRATIVGVKSFGKGSVQTVIPFPGYGAIRLTTAKYFTPSGRSIQQVGIEPDVKIEAPRPEAAVKGHEPRSEADLKHALPNPAGATRDKLPAAKPAAPPAAPAAAPGEPQKDIQLDKALEVLRDLAQKRPAK